MDLQPRVGTHSRLQPGEAVQRHLVRVSVRVGVRAGVSFRVRLRVRVRVRVTYGVRG